MEYSQPGLTEEEIRAMQIKQAAYIADYGKSLVSTVEQLTKAVQEADKKRTIAVRLAWIKKHKRNIDE